MSEEEENPWRRKKNSAISNVDNVDLSVEVSKRETKNPLLHNEQFVETKTERDKVVDKLDEIIPVEVNPWAVASGVSKAKSKFKRSLLLRGMRGESNNPAVSKNQGKSSKQIVDSKREAGVKEELNEPSVYTFSADGLDVPGRKEMDNFLKEKAQLLTNLSEIESVAAAIRSLQQKLEFAVTEKQEKKLSKTLELIQMKGTRKCKEAKWRLQIMKSSTTDLPKSRSTMSSTAHNALMRQTPTRKKLEAALGSRLVITIQDYQSAANEYREALKAKVTRQILNVKSNATKEEIDLCLEEGTTTRLQRAQLQQKLANIKIVQKAEDIRAKAVDVKRLAKHIAELRRMWEDLATIVEVCMIAH
eukprot:g2600.t1